MADVPATSARIAPHLHLDSWGEIADLCEVSSSGLQNPAPTHVIAKDAELEDVIAEKAVE
jgi:hypothetical protein